MQEGVDVDVLTAERRRRVAKYALAVVPMDEPPTRLGCCREDLAIHDGVGDGLRPIVGDPLLGRRWKLGAGADRDARNRQRYRRSQCLETVTCAPRGGCPYALDERHGVCEREPPRSRGVQVAAHRPRAFVVMRVCRQTAIGEVDAPAIQELAAGREGDDHHRVAVLGDADGRGSLYSPLRHRHRISPEKPLPGRGWLRHVTYLFSATILALVALARPAMQTGPSRAVAFTFDDLPATHAAHLATTQESTFKLLRTLRDHQVPATGFVNENGLFVGGNAELAARTALLEAWLDAGFDLGNHTYSHVSIDRVPFETYKADLVKGEIVTRRLLAARGRHLRYFRHPQLRTGPTAEYKAALDALLAERGYLVAPVTIDNNDFMLADVYARARATGDLATMERVVRAYVPYMESVTAHFENLSRQFLGYEVKQILLLHANELNADHVGDLIAMFRNRGYRFIPLDEALRDPAFALQDSLVPRGLSWLHRWMLAKGLPVQAEPLEPLFVRELFDRAYQ
jgi:peptidoglycan-N-acetylglucosamine deacetylase